MSAKRFRIASLVLVSAMLVSIAGTTAPVHALAACADAATAGCWSAPFQPGATTGASSAAFNVPPPATPTDSLKLPAAATAVVLPSGVVEYWNGLQNLEDARAPLPLDAGGQAGSSITGVLDLRGAGSPLFYVDAAPPGDDLFCTDQRLTQDGTLVAVGGTHWQSEIPTPAEVSDAGGPRGLAELYGSKDQHTLPTATTSATSGSDWGTSDPLHWGRWYPTMTTMPNGNLFIAGGVSKLLWNSSLLDQADSDDTDNASDITPYNVNQTEIRNLDGSVTQNPSSADASFPLFARMHLLPNGSILYSGAGQMWGPAGEAMDEADWGKIRTLDTNDVAAGWTHIGDSAFLGLPQSGAFSTLLPLQPPYDTANVLVSGGTLGPAPGGEVATDLSQEITAHKESDGTWSYSIGQAPSLANRRWFSTAVTLPNGEVAAFNGADIDEVIMPGTEGAIRTAEIRDAVTGEWRSVSAGSRDRTYHNSAILLADGSVLVGGHAPINAYYGDKGGTYPSRSNNLKDPSFERFFPPYLYKGPRPSFNAAQKHADWGPNNSITVTLDPNSAAPIDHWVLSRLPSDTHTTDADARTVVLPPASAPTGNATHLTIPGDRSVVPPGFYYLFAISDQGVPSNASVIQVAPQSAWIDAGFTANPIELDATIPAASASGVSPVSLPAKSAAKTPAIAAPALIDNAQRVALPGASTGSSRAATTAAGGLLALAGAALVSALRRRKLART